jgi:hypothetical protein
MTDELYDRQLRLPEVGAAGQARIAEARVEVHGNDGAILEAEYLHRAGVLCLEIRPRLEPVPFRHESAFRFAAPRRVGAGAWRALHRIKKLVGVSA